MKKKIFALSAAVLISALFVIGCKQADDSTHTDTAFLVGTWASQNSGKYTFTIHSDLTFECILINPAGPGGGNALINGSLDANASNLGPNGYRLRNLHTTGDDVTYAANATLSGAVASMNDILVTLSPKENYTKFTFTSTNPMAGAFFGNDGDFVKDEEP